MVKKTFRIAMLLFNIVLFYYLKRPNVSIAYLANIC